MRARDPCVGQAQVAVGVTADRDRRAGSQRHPTASVEAGDDAQLERSRRGCVDVPRRPAGADPRALVEADLVERELAVAEATVEHEPGTGAVAESHQQVTHGRLRVDRRQLHVDRGETVPPNHDVHPACRLPVARVLTVRAQQVEVLGASIRPSELQELVIAERRRGAVPVPP